MSLLSKYFNAIAMYMTMHMILPWCAYVTQYLSCNALSDIRYHVISIFLLSEIFENECHSIHAAAIVYI